MANIKETLELVTSVTNAVDPLVKLKGVYDKVYADDTLSLSDVIYLRELLADLAAVRSAIQPGLEGVGLIKDEIKDLSLDEAQQLLEAVVALVVKVVSVIK